MTMRGFNQTRTPEWLKQGWLKQEWLKQGWLKHPMILAAALALFVTPLLASEFDNEAGVYTLTALPDPVSEAKRMDRMQLSDQQPAGREVRRGETVAISVEGLPAGFTLAASVGFLPMWEVQQTEQLQPLAEGENRFRVNQSGPLFFRFNAPRGRTDARNEVMVRVKGGTALPLYVDGSMDVQDWDEELAAHADANFVQLISEHALITLPSDVHAREPVVDPGASLAVIDEVIRLQDELAGFDGSTKRDRLTRLRLHYLVDFRVSASDRENFYMYATDQFIGMLDDNTADLTDPANLRKQWAIWHETGHTQQQNSWTFEALGEVNVNLFSLYVQERFGQQSRLEESEDDEPSILEQARDYLEQGAPDYLAEPDDDTGFFIKLVMFHQLQQAYGWELIQQLHKHFRAQPLPEDAVDEDRVDAFVEALCELTGNDLRTFFERWGLSASARANAHIEAQGYPEPDNDL